MMDTKYMVLIAIACVALGYFVARNSITPSVVTNTVTVQGQPDTVLVHDTTTIVAHMPAKHDTVFINNQMVQRATLDTTLVKDSSSVALHIAYVPLWDTFDVNATFSIANRTILRVDTIKTETVITLAPSNGLLDRFSLGIGYGYGLNGDKAIRTPFIGILYRIF
jgi:hypothetical protein